MTLQRIIVLGLVGLGLTLSGIPRGLAQFTKPASPAAPAKPAPGSAEPQTTTTTFDDWVLRCTQMGAAQQNQRSCELVQSVMVKSQTSPQSQPQQQPFAQFAIGKPSASEPLHFTVVVPLNVSFPSSVRASVDEKDPRPIEIAWTRCVPAGCFASVVLNDEVLKRWRPLSTSGRVTFKNAAGQDVIMPLSFRGLAQALDALAKER